MKKILLELKLLITLTALFIGTCLIAPDAKSQVISTVLTTGGVASDDITFDSNGNTYFATFTSITRRNALGVDTVFASGFSELQCMVIDSIGNLYVTDFGTSIIYKILPNGTSTVFSTGVPNPIGLVLDKNGNMYASAYLASSIYKIDNAGNATFFASIGASRAAQMVIDDDGNLYCNGYYDATLYKITQAGTVSPVATFPGTTVGLSFGKEKDFYVTGYSSHQIYRLDSAGVISIYAGSGVAGTSDGPVLSATMNNPSMIKFDSKGDLYFGDEGSGSFRKVSNMYFVALNPNKVNYCTGDSILIPFQTSHLDSIGNVFTAQLSDAVGNFSSPLTIGSLSVRSSDTIHAILPANLAAGTNYKVRVISSDISDTSHVNTSSINISVPSPVYLGNDTIVCSPQTVLLNAGSGFGYLWSDNSTNQTLTTSLAGLYYVTITNSGGCVSMDSINVAVTICTEINETSKIRIEIYPNPATEKLVIHSSEKIKKVNCLNYLGQTVSVKFENNSIDISTLSKGIYFLSIISENGRNDIQKFIKE